MLVRGLKWLLQDESAAVAPTVALSLVGLIAAGGIAFDYARLATMDTELQTAADQAALAAASQLDGSADARTRATSAATALIANPTRFSNDKLGRDVGIASVIFYLDKAKTTVAATDGEAKYVEVTVATRRANYALTPIVAAFGGDLNAKAMAGVGSAICGVVPFFICNPTEPVGNQDYNYEANIAPGTGIVMAEGGSQWGPGNFGFLEQLGNGASSVAEALASNALFGQCSATDSVTTQTGNILNAVRDSLNMRFDFDPGNSSACKSGPCSPSTNVMKDLVRVNTGSSCSWQQNPATDANFASKRYRPTSNAALPSSVTPEIMGHPRDICHAFGPSYACAYGRIGDGVWDRAAYFRSNHPGVDWQNTTGLGADVTRYQTYLWEAGDVASRLPNKTVSGDPSLAAYNTPQSGKCVAPGLAPDPSGIDRRRITAAVVNCRKAAQDGLLNGKKTIPVASFIDVFLVEPSVARNKCDGNAKSGCTVEYTSANDIYVEVVGTAGSGEGSVPAQISRRDMPRLIE